MTVETRSVLGVGSDKFCSLVGGAVRIPVYGAFRARPQVYPGGQPIDRPASTCACRWNTLWPTSAPVLQTVR